MPNYIPTSLNAPRLAARAALAESITRNNALLRKHTFEDREDGLASCTVCGGGESSLPTDCPGRRMTADEMDAVSAGRIQFKSGKMGRVIRERKLCARHTAN